MHSGSAIYSLGLGLESNVVVAESSVSVNIEMVMVMNRMTDYEKRTLPKGVMHVVLYVSGPILL